MDRMGRDRVVFLGGVWLVMAVSLARLMGVVQSDRVFAVALGACCISSVFWLVTVSRSRSLLDA